MTVGMTVEPTADAALQETVPTIDAIRLKLTGPGAAFETEPTIIDGVEARVWKNIPPTFRTVLEGTRAHGDREVIVYENERATYRGFFLAAATLAHDLIQRGFKKGDRVAIAMRNLPEWPVAYFATVAIGGVVTPLNAWGTAVELCYGLADSGARFAIVDAERLDRISGPLSDLNALETVYVARPTEATEANCVALDTVIGRPADWASLMPVDLPVIDVNPDDIATIYYTSGTTGKPKGAFATHRAALSNIAAIPFAATRTVLRNGGAMPVSDPAAPPRIMLINLPLFHVTGCNVLMVPAINAGNKLVIMHKWDVVRAMELIERERITNTGGVPALAWQLLEHPRRSEFDLSSLGRINWGWRTGLARARTRHPDCLSQRHRQHRLGHDRT